MKTRVLVDMAVLCAWNMGVSDWPRLLSTTVHARQASRPIHNSFYQFLHIESPDGLDFAGVRGSELAPLRLEPQILWGIAQADQVNPSMVLGCYYRL